MTKDYSKLSLEELQNEMDLCKQRRGAYSPEKMTRALDRLTCQTAIKKALYAACNAKRDILNEGRSRSNNYRTR